MSSRIFDPVGSRYEWLMLRIKIDAPSPVHRGKPICFFTAFTTSHVIIGDSQRIDMRPDGAHGWAGLDGGLKTILFPCAKSVFSQRCLGCVIPDDAVVLSTTTPPLGAAVS